MKLLTLNCHSWQEENQQHKIRLLAKRIKEQDYDVIALQEVSQHIEGNLVEQDVKDTNFVYALLEELKKLGITHYDFRWAFSHIGYDVYEEGLCILSKHPIIEEDRFFITHNHNTAYWKTRRILRTTILYEEQAIDFYTCHLGWWTDEEEPFKDQVDKLNERINHERLSFIMGDFNNNANKREEGYDYMSSKGWIDTYTVAKKKDKGITVQGQIAGWETNQEALRLDLIWTNKQVSVEESRVCFNGMNGDIVSDHFGVEITCQ